MATRDLLKAVLRNPGAVLVPGGSSEWLSRVPGDAELGRLYRGALRSFLSVLSTLMLDLVRRLGPRRAMQLLRGNAAPGEEDLQRVLASAEWLTQMLAHLHIGRLLAEQAERWPERRPLARRFLVRTSDVCALNARRIGRGDPDVARAIAAWRDGVA
jgi:hypothetical protein